MNLFRIARRVAAISGPNQCKNCRGTGFVNMGDCPECGGTGMRPQSRPTSQTPIDDIASKVMEAFRTGQVWEFAGESHRVLELPGGVTVITHSDYPNDPSKAWVEIVVDLDEDEYEKRFHEKPDTGGYFGWTVDIRHLDLTNKAAVRDWVTEMDNEGVFEGYDVN